MQEQGATQARCKPTGASPRIRVAVVEAGFTIRKGLCAAISQSGLELAGEFLPGEASAERMRDLRPDVVLLGVDADPAGLRLLDAIREAAPDAAVVVVITAKDCDFLLQAIDHGATSYLPIDVTPCDLLAAVEAAVHGRTLLRREDLARAVAPVARGRPQRPQGADPASRLTRREREVLSLLGEGRSTQQIAERLTVTQGTVKAHLSSIYRKLGVSGHVEAALVAAGHGPGAVGRRPLESAG